MSEELRPRPCARVAFERPTKLEDWPGTPQSPSGQLAASNSGWRSLWPEIELEACNACGLCGLFCPEGAIVWDAARLPQVEADWCKGCGLCARECPKKLISMRPEEAGR